MTGERLSQLDARYVSAASAGVLARILGGMTVPTSSLDRWKAGRSRPSTCLNGAIASGATTLTVRDPSITPTALHRPLWIEGEEIFTAGGEGNAFPAMTGVTSVASTGIFTKTAHGLQAGQIVIPAAGVLDSFLVVGTAYYVSATNLAANTFSLAATPGGAVLTGTTNDTSLTLTLYGVLTVATRGSVNGSAAVSHADQAPVYATKVKTVVHIADSVGEGTDNQVPKQANDGWTLRAARMLSDRMGGLVAQSWPLWRSNALVQPHQEYTLSGTATPATNQTFDVGWEGALIWTAGTGNGFTWTRPPGERVQAIDFAWVDYGAAGAQWSYSWDGVAWIDNPIASIYSSGKGILRRTRIACNDPATFRVRAATAAGTAKTQVWPLVPVTTWRAYPSAAITEGVHWANLGHAGVKLRSILNARVVHDCVTDGAGGLSSASAAFVANDVNSYIFVNGVQTTIATRTNGTTATSTAALAAGSGQRLTILQGSGTGDWMANFFGHQGGWFPDLVIIGPYDNDIVNGGTGGDGDYDFYGDLLQWLYTQISPVADVLFIAPAESGSQPSGLQASYRSVMHTIAAANNAALLDLYDAFSAYGYTGYAAVNAGGFMQDAIHFDYKGNNWMGSHLKRVLEMI